MKVLFFSHYANLYGANKSLLNMILGLRKYGVEAHVILPFHGDVCQLFQDNHIAYSVIKFSLWVDKEVDPNSDMIHQTLALLKQLRRKWWHTPYNWWALRKISATLQAFAPDLVYSNSSVIDIGLNCAHKFKLPHVWHFREFGKEDYHFKFLLDNARVKTKFNQSQGIICISKAIQQYYQVKFAIRHSEVVYNGVVSLERLRQLDEIRLAENTRRSRVTFGLVGLINEQKGQSEALRAFSLVNKQLPNVAKLIFVGDGQIKGLQADIEALGLTDSVECTGFIRNPMEKYRDFDVVLMCSKNEGFGRVTAEAMAACLPVIGHKSGGTKEIIDDEVTGLFYEPGHVDLAEKMIYMLKNPSKRAEMGRQARIKFESNYTQEQYCAQIYSILERVVNNEFSDKRHVQ